MDSSQVGAAAGEYLDGTRKQAEEQGGFGTGDVKGILGGDQDAARGVCLF